MVMETPAAVFQLQRQKHCGKTGTLVVCGCEGLMLHHK